jgi:hypothetical protein
VWKKHLEILLYCWVIWKVAEVPPPPLRRLILVVRFGVLATQFGVSPCVGVANSRRHKGGGVWLGLPSRGLSPKHKKLVFWLFLLSYMTSGPFSWWYFLLLTQRFFWYYFSRKVMANLCCVAQKAASAAQKWSFLLKSKSDCPAQPRKNGTTQLSARPLALLDVHPCLYQ